MPSRFVRSAVLVALLGLFLAPASVQAKGPKAADRSVRIVRELIDGEPFYCTFPLPQGPGGFGLMITGVKNVPGKRRPQPLTQAEFDALYAKANVWRDSRIAHKKSVGWTTNIQFLWSTHYDLAFDIPKINLNKASLGTRKGNADMVSAMIEYGHRAERLWNDFEAVFGPIEFSDVMGRQVVYLHDKLAECALTCEKVLKEQINLGARRGMRVANMFWDRPTTPADADLWEYYTHFLAGMIVSQYKGMGKNQGWLPGWLDEGFAFYLTRIHRELDTHTTILYQEQIDQLARHIDGGTWRSYAQGLARRNAQPLALLKSFMGKNVAALTQDERILGWSVTWFLIETDKTKFREYIRLQKNAGQPGLDHEQALEKAYGWTQGELADRWKAWLDGRPFMQGGEVDLTSLTTWRAFEKAFDKVMRASNDPQKKARYVSAIARFDQPEAVYKLYLVLKANPAEDVVQAVKNVVARFKSTPSLTALFSIIYEGKFGRKKTPDLKLRVTLFAGTEKSVAPLDGRIALGCANRDSFALRVLACDLLGARGVEHHAEAYLGAVIGCLDDEIKAVRIAAVRALVGLVTADNELTVLQALIDRYYKEKGTVRTDLFDALKAITGEDWGPSYHRWARWLQLYRQARAKGEKQPRPNLDDPKKNDGDPGMTRAGGKTPTYFGEPIHSKQLVFVIDRSHSMMEPVANLKKLKEEFTKRGRRPGVITGGPKAGEDGGKKPEDKEKKLPWDKINVKWDLARETLWQTLQELTYQYQFTIVLYDHRVFVWSEKLVPANEKNKKAAHDWLFNQPDADGAQKWGRTNIYDALAKGLELTVGERIVRKGDGRQKGPVITDNGADDVNLSQKGAEEIFFLTDGDPTDGTWVNSDEILAHLRALNRIRKVKINTYGIGRHNTSLLQRIASQSKGKYHDFSFQNFNK